MKKSLEILMNEHRVIEQVLNCLEKILERCSAEGRLDRESARQALDFFRAFADRGHHGKEEIQLFPLLETRGMGSPCGPLAVMRREHELGRLYVQGMEGAVEAASAGEPESVQWFLQHGQSLIRLLREHIGKEDHCLFPRADQWLNAEDDAALLAEYARFEAAEFAPNAQAGHVASADQLADRYGVQRAAQPESVTTSDGLPIRPTTSF